MKEGVKGFRRNLGVKSAKVSSNSQENYDTGVFVVDDSSASSQQPPPKTGKVKNSHLPNSSPGNPHSLPLIRWFFWSAAFILTAMISAALGATLALVTPLSPLIVPNQGIDLEGSRWRRNFQYDLARPVNILVMGIDRVIDAPKGSSEALAGRSDTMLLLRLDPTDNSVRMLSIPRDTRVQIPGIGLAKINDANVEGGSALAARVVSRTLNNVPIDRYVRVTTDAFRELVDLVGGIEVFVPQPMKYTDVYQNLEIDLEQGWQTLNGDQAEQFARFRQENGDIGRVQRQQVLLKALRQRLVSPTVLPRLPKLIRVMQQYIDTNLSLEEILALLGFSLELEQDDFKMVLLPGRFSVKDEYEASYWLMDPLGRDRLVREYFQQTSEETDRDTRRSPNQVRIAIQNTTDDPELSSRVAQYLAQKEFYNVYFVKDWPDQLRQTQIIVQQGDLEAAATVKKVLGLGKVEASSTGDLRSELTIRIGQDWLDRELRIEN